MLNQKNTLPSKKYSVAKKIRHPNYSDSTLQNDIALLILSEEVELNNYIQIACLPDRSISLYPTLANIDIFIVGWGDTTRKFSIIIEFLLSFF